MIIFNQSQYKALVAKMRQVNIRLDILNKNDIIVDSYEGIATSGGISMSGDSAYRRMANLTLILQNALLPNDTSKIWFGTKVRVVVNLNDDSEVDFPVGKFVIQKCTINNEEISLTLPDYMSMYDGTLGGKLGYITKFDSDDMTITDIFKAICAVLGIKAIINPVYDSEGVEATLPYELEFNADQTYYDIFSKLIDIYMGYECFFDENGIFIVQRVKDFQDSNILYPYSWKFLEDEEDVTVGSSHDIDFSTIKNSIYIWGRKETTGQIKWVYKNKYARDTILARNVITGMSKGDICYVKETNLSYCWDGTSAWEALSFNVIPKYNIENIGEKIYSLSQDTIYTLPQAKTTAEYYLWLYSNFADNISVSCIPIYGLEVNQKIYVKRTKQQIDGDYLIQSISIPFSIDEDMSITARKLYY